MFKSIQDSKDKPDPRQAESKDNRQRGSAKKKDIKNSRAEGQPEEKMCLNSQGPSREENSRPATLTYQEGLTQNKSSLSHEQG